MRQSAQQAPIKSRHTFVHFKQLLTRKPTVLVISAFAVFCQFLPLGFSASRFKPVKNIGKNQFISPPANPVFFSRYLVPRERLKSQRRKKTQLMLLRSTRNLCNALNFTVKFRDHILSPISEVKNLGLTFHRTLNWDAHVKSLTRRCFGALSGLSHLRGRLPSSVISVLVNALVLSQVRYCITVYGNGSKKNVSRI